MELSGIGLLPFRVRVSIYLKRIDLNHRAGLFKARKLFNRLMMLLVYYLTGIVALHWLRMNYLLLLKIFRQIIVCNSWLASLESKQNGGHVDAKCTIQYRIKYKILLFPCHAPTWSGVQLVACKARIYYYISR